MIKISTGQSWLSSSTDTIPLWQSFHNFIEETPHNIITSAAFNFINRLPDINRKHEYMGGGFKYSFWLESQEALDDFVVGYVEIFGDAAVHELDISY